MDTEYEATFLDVNKENIRKVLKKSGAKLIRPEFLQKRNVFTLTLVDPRPQKSTRAHPKTPLAQTLHLDLQEPSESN